MKNNSMKLDRLEIRISLKQEMMIKLKTENYKLMSNMIQEAIRQFDETGTMRKIEKLNEMVELYKKYHQELSWLSGNLNQVINRACELATLEEGAPGFLTDIFSLKLTKAKN